MEPFKYAQIHSIILWLRSRIWYLLEWVLEEFSPWLKWLVFDAVLRLAVQYLVKRSERLRNLFERVGLADY